jgi:hypothetical protein
LKSILKESNKELCKKRLNLMDSEKKVSFGETVYVNWFNVYLIHKFLSL